MLLDLHLHFHNVEEVFDSMDSKGDNEITFPEFKKWPVWSAALAAGFRSTMATA